jgi:hypothetical protein
MSKRFTSFPLALLTLALALGPDAGAAAHAQNTQSQTQSAQSQNPQTQDAQGQPGEDEETRQIKYSDFTKERPAAKKNSSSSSSGSGDSASWNAPTYHRVKPAAAPVRRRHTTRPVSTTATTTTAKKPTTTTTSTAAKTPNAQPTDVKDVGVTLWRLRPANDTDTGPAFNVLQGGKMVVMVPERIEGTSPVALGDRVRISIESPRDGYLYVINREQYADGSVGDPALIFPTTRIRGGDNKVSAGRLVDIPDSADSQPYFTLRTEQKPGEPQTVGELITIVISPRPIDGITPANKPIMLAPAQVAKWENDWEGDVADVLEMNGGAGRAWTSAEKQAGEATRSLTQEDPTPQTIYRVAGRPNEPLMLTVQMIYGSKSAPQTGATSSTSSKP